MDLGRGDFFGVQTIFFCSVTFRLLYAVGLPPNSPIPVG